MDITVFSQLFALIQAHQWVPLSALVIGLVIRVLKDDTIGPSIPAPVRKWAALGLGAAAGVVRSMMGGMPIGQALVEGLAAGLTAMAGHDVVIEGMRKGRELRVPGLMKKDGDGKGPTGGAAVGLAVFLATSAGALCFGCALFSKGPANAVEEACKWLDSGNPEVGALCLTAEEIASVFSHVKATRSRAKFTPGTHEAVDICAGVAP